MKRCHFVCGGASLPESWNEKEDVRRLDVQGSNRNVDLRIESLSRALMDNIPDSVMDLLEVGAYVFCADQQTGRGSEMILSMDVFGELEH